MKFNSKDWEILGTITDLKDVPEGAVNIRWTGYISKKNRPLISDNITSFTDKPGIIVEIKPGTKE